MAIGLGMTQSEWHDLRAQVDDSFWVMRVIGTISFVSSVKYVNAKLRQDIPLYPTTMMDFLVVLTGGHQNLVII